MGVDDSFSPIQFLEQWSECGIAQPLVPVAREQPDPVRLEHVERILDLAKTGIDVQERH